MGLRATAPHGHLRPPAQPQALSPTALRGQLTTVACVCYFISPCLFPILTHTPPKLSFP